MCVFSAQYKFLHTIYVLFDVTTFTTYSLFVYRLLKTEAVRLLAMDKVAKKSLDLIGIRIGSDLAVKGSSSNGLDVPGVLSTCEPGLPSPPAQHNSKVFHKAGQHTNDHSYLHLYTLLLLNSIPSFNSV